MVAALSGFTLGFVGDIGHLLLERHLANRDRATSTQALINFVTNDCEAKRLRANQAMEDKLKREEEFYRNEVERIGNIAAFRGLSNGGPHLQNVQLAKTQHEEREANIRRGPELLADSCKRLIDSLNSTGGPSE